MNKLAAYRIPPPKKLLTKIRAYLLWQRDEAGNPGNVVESELKCKDSDGRVLINLGPTIDPGFVDHHFVLSSGARLSFAITIKPDSSKSRLISYRFDYRRDGPAQLPFVRLEIRESAHHEPLREPIAHFHPGIEDLRLPTELVDPFDVLDLVFFVIDPKLQ